jgi:hypothetical protein
MAGDNASHARAAAGDERRRLKAEVEEKVIVPILGLIWADNQGWADLCALVMNMIWEFYLFIYSRFFENK